MVKPPTCGTENFHKMILNFSRLIQEDEEIENKMLGTWQRVDCKSVEGLMKGTMLTKGNRLKQQCKPAGE